MKNIVFSAGIVFMLSGPVFAQQTLLGKYSGSFMQTASRGDINIGITLEILSVDGDIVTGKAIRSQGGAGRSSCHGEYPVEGKVKGDALSLRATKKGRPCRRLRFVAQVDGGWKQAGRNGAELQGRAFEVVRLSAIDRAAAGNRGRGYPASRKTFRVPHLAAAPAAAPAMRPNTAPETRPVPLG